MKKSCYNEDDFKYNSDKLFQILDEIGIVTHFNRKDLIYCNARENIIFGL